MQALTTLIAQAKSEVTYGYLIPGTVPIDYVVSQVGNYIENIYGYNTDVGGETMRADYTADRYTIFPTRATNAFQGTLSVRGNTNATPVIFRIWINGEDVGTTTLEVTSIPGNSTPLGVSIPKGLVSIKVEVVSGTARIGAIIVG